MSNQPSDDPFKETMLKKRDQSTRYKSIEEIFPILSNPKERKKYYGCSTGANLSQEILDFWTSALEKVHTEVFKSASVSYGDLLDYFKTKDGEMPSLKAYIRYYSSIGQYGVYQSVEQNQEEFRFRRSDVDLKKTKTKKNKKSIWGMLNPMNFLNFIKPKKKSGIALRDSFRLDPRLTVVNLTYLNQLQDMIYPKNNNLLAKIFGKNVLMNKTNLIEMISLEAQITETDVKIILHNLEADEMIYKNLVKQGKQHVVLYSLQPRDSEVVKVAIFKKELQDNINRIKGYRDDLEVKLNNFDLKIKREVREGLQEDGAQLRRDSNPKREKIKRMMRRKKTLKNRLKTVYNKVQLLEKALDDLEAMENDKEISKCLNYINDYGEEHRKNIGELNDIVRNIKNIDNEREHLYKDIEFSDQSSGDDDIEEEYNRLKKEVEMNTSQIFENSQQETERNSSKLSQRYNSMTPIPEASSEQEKSNSRRGNSFLGSKKNSETEREKGNTNANQGLSAKIQFNRNSNKNDSGLFSNGKTTLQNPSKDNPFLPLSQQFRKPSNGLFRGIERGLKGEESSTQLNQNSQATVKQPVSINPLAGYQAGVQGQGLFETQKKSTKLKGGIGSMFDYDSNDDTDTQFRNVFLDTKEKMTFGNQRKVGSQSKGGFFSTFQRPEQKRIKTKPMEEEEQPQAQLN